MLTDEGKPSKHFDVAYGTIEWLLDSGYIRSSHDLSAHGLTGAVLTAKGLTVLKAVPKSVSNSDSFGDKLSLAVRTGAADTARELLKAIFARGAEMVMPGMP